MTELKEIPKLQENTRSKTINFFISSAITMGLVVSPLACRVGYAVVRLVDSLPKMNDPMQRGEVYETASKVFGQSWDRRSAAVILETLDRADEGKALALMQVVPRVVLAAYGINVDFNPVYNEWSKIDKVSELQKRTSQKLEEAGSRRAERVVEMKKILGLMEKDKGSDSKLSAQEIFKVNQEKVAAAGDVLTNLDFLNVDNGDSRNEMIKKVIGYMDSQKWETLNSVEKSELTRSLKEKYANLRKQIIKYGLSEGFRTAVFLYSPEEIYSYPDWHEGTWEEYQTLDKRHASLSFKEISVLFRLQVKMRAINQHTDRLADNASNYLPTIREFLTTERSDTEGISDAIAKAERMIKVKELSMLEARRNPAKRQLVDESFLSRIRNPKSRYNLIEKYALRKYDFLHSGLANYNWGLINIDTDYLSDVYIYADCTPREFLARFSKNYQNILESMRQDNDPETVWKLFPSLSREEQDDVASNLHDYVTNNLVVGAMTQSSNFLYGPSSFSTYLATSEQAVFSINEYLRQSSLFGGDMEAARLFPAVALHVFRQRGVDEHTNWRDVKETMEIWARVIGPYYEQSVKISGLGYGDWSIVDKQLILRELLDVVVNTDLLLNVHELNRVNPSFEIFDGKTFAGVRAQIDPRSMTLTDHRVGANTSLSPNEVSFVMPWTYFVHKQEAMGLIDFAATKVESSQELEVVSADKSDQYFRNKNNRAKKFIAVLESGEVMIGTYSDYVTGNEENPTETLMEKLQHRQVKSIFTPDVFYDSNQPEPLIGFKDVRMAQFDSSFLVISRQNDGSTRIDLIEAKGIGQEGFKLLHDQPGDIYEPIINEDDLMENIKTQIPGTVLFVANGDPGHSVIVADENGSVYIYSGVGETETNRVNGTIIH